MLVRRIIAGLAAVLAVGGSAQGAIKIGVLTDMTSLYSDINGPGSVEAARMAAEVAGAVMGQPVEVVFADTQNKPDIGSTIARQWYDARECRRDRRRRRLVGRAGGRGDLARQEEDRAVLEPGELRHHRRQMLALRRALDLRHLCAGAQHRRGRGQGGRRQLVLPDRRLCLRYALQRDTAAVVVQTGGKVLGEVRAPFNSQDLSSFLLQAQASKAKIIGLANAGGDTINSIKQGVEFGITRGGQKFAGLLLLSSDVHTLGLETAQGILLTEAFYWDQDDAARAFSKRFAERRKRPPTSIQAGVYSAVAHYLKAVKALGAKDADAVMAKMRALPIDDFMTRHGSLRIDGRVLRDM